MDDSVNYAEYTVEQKPEGKNLRKRILFVAAYLIFVERNIFLRRTV